MRGAFSPSPHWRRSHEEFEARRFPASFIHRASQPETPRRRPTPTGPPSPAEPSPPSKPAPSPSSPPVRNDGFETNSPSRVSQPQAKPPGGSDVTSSFTQDPVKFASQKDNVLNILNTQRPAGVPAATAQAPFVNASDSIVTMSAHQRPGGNVNMHLTPPNGKGSQVHYLDYLPEGSGRFAGIQGV